MECREVQDNLNNYIEGILPSEALKSFEEHIALCSKCKEELADLQKTITHIKDFEELEPPPWLAQKVMAKVREEAELKKDFFHKIFYPLHIKLPIEAAAVFFVAVISIYIFKSIGPQIQLAKAPSEMELPQSFYQEKGALKPQEKEKLTDDKTAPALSLNEAKHTEEPPKQIEYADRYTKTVEKENIQPASPETPAPAAPSLPAKHREESFTLGKAESKDIRKKPAQDNAASSDMKYEQDKQKSDAKVSSGIRSDSEAGSAFNLAHEKRPAAGGYGGISKKEDSYEFEKITRGNYPNGNPKIIITYKTINNKKMVTAEERFDENRQRHGIHREYYDSGRLKAEVEYNYGNIAWYMEYNPDGTKKTGKTSEDWLWLKKY